MLFVACVVVITPVSIVDNLMPILQVITNTIGEKSMVSEMIYEYISPLILLAFNSGIVPLFIDLVAFLEGHKYKSIKQLGIMRKVYFFQIMSIIFLHLTAQATILSFLGWSIHQDISSIPENFGKNLVNNNFFFVRFSIQLTFISNAI